MIGKQVVWDYAYKLIYGISSPHYCMRPFQQFRKAFHVEVFLRNYELGWKLLHTSSNFPANPSMVLQISFDNTFIWFYDYTNLLQL